jgi:hypothetical protein
MFLGVARTQQTQGLEIESLPIVAMVGKHAWILLEDEVIEAEIICKDLVS